MTKEQLDIKMDQLTKEMEAVLEQKHDPKCHWGTKKRLKAKFHQLAEQRDYYYQQWKKVA